MKKSLAFALTALAVVGAAVGGAFTQKAHDENKFSYPWDSTSANTDSDAPDQTISSASGSLSAKVSGGTVFGANGIRKSVAKGATKTVTFTVSPATATDKYVVVATSDATKVSVSATKVLSGAAVTLTLANGEFNGTVSITAHPEALPTSVVTIPVTVYNFVKTMTLTDILLVDTAYTTKSDLVANKVLAVPDVTANGNITSDAPVSYLDWTAATKTSVWTLTDSADFEFVYVFTLNARDSSAALGVTSLSDSDCVLDKEGAGAYLIYNTNKDFFNGSKSSTSTAKSIVVEDASCTLNFAAYVAPSGLAGDVGGVQFK